MFEKIGAQLDIVGQCKRYGLSVWQCPQFLFVVMGAFIILASVVSYLIGARYILSPETVIFIVLIVASILFIIAFVITRSFERLAEASRMKSEFINIVSHQLRSPLTNIKWTFEVMASEEFKVPAEKQEEYFVNVKENIARMVELIDDLLIVSKIEQGSFSVAKIEISLEDLIGDLVERYKVFAEASRIKLNFYSQENLPKVLADPSLLKIVTENLIDNAIRYTKGGGVVEIKLIKEKDKVLFAIKDSGVGIPQKEQKYIFQKFFRAENISKERTRGSGLGLYVCKSILDKLGGQIWFKSQLGKGTTFYFRLPIK
jgi:signal transduction histidine kinase